MKHLNLWALTGVALLSLAACSDDETIPTGTPDYQYVGQAVGNFTAAEWYPGGELGTTTNTSSSSYEDEAPAVTDMGLSLAFKSGEQQFERNFVEDLGATTAFKGLGPAWVRKSCIDCHPGYGHGARQDSYDANKYGNGYLLVVYHNADGVDANGNRYTKDSYISEVTGMPQTKASSPFLPPIDESKITITWPHVTSMPSELAQSDGSGNFSFPDGETFSLIYPEVSIKPEAFNTNPIPTDYEVRLESTIGIYGSGLLDAIPVEEMKKQYQEEAQYATLNPAMWDAAKKDWAGDPSLGVANGAWYKLADGTMAVKKFTYAMTRASLQDGPGANAIWNITNVTRSDRTSLYTTNAWAKAMSENASVISSIKNDPTSPYYADGTDEGIKNAVYTLLSPATDQTNNNVHNFTAEMSDKVFYDLMVWHRGLAVPRARDLNSATVQRGKEVFYEIGCTNCHRPSWQTGNDDYWAPANIKRFGDLPKFENQTIWPYTDMVQHRLFMINDIRTGWCRTTPLWGRGLSQQNTGASDRLHDCRARNVIEAIMWHGYSKESDAYYATEKFYKLPKADRDAVVAFINAI